MHVVGASASARAVSTSPSKGTTTAMAVRNSAAAATTMSSDVAAVATSSKNITGRRCRPNLRIPLPPRCHGLSTASRLQPTSATGLTLDTNKGVGARGVRASAAQADAAEASPRRLVSPTTSDVRQELVGALAADSSLDERISSGEFTDSGSTKERASRPVRKFLALDPVGPGEAFFI